MDNYAPSTSSYPDVVNYTRNSYTAWGRNEILIIFWDRVSGNDEEKCFVMATLKGKWEIPEGGEWK